MKIIQLIAVLGVFAAASSTAISARAADRDGVAVAIIYDTSGSMQDAGRDGAGKKSPKYVIANRALESIATRIQTFATNTASGEPRNIQAGLFTFDGTDAKIAVKFGPFDARAFHDWAQNFKHPNGTTPLGKALKAAGQTVLNSNGETSAEGPPGQYDVVAPLQVQAVQHDAVQMQCGEMLRA